MALIGHLSGSTPANPVMYITGGLHLTSSGNPNMEDAYPYIAIESTSGSLTAVGGVTDKLHNRNGVLYFGGTNLEGGITVANDSNDNGILTSDGDGTYSNEANLEFDGTDLVIAGGGKVAFRDNGGEYIYSVADNTLGIVSNGNIGMVATQVSSSGMLYTATGVFTSGMVAATGSITARGALMVTGSGVVMGALNVSGNLDCNGTLTCDDSLTIDSITITDTELGYLDGLTLGTVAASKVVTADSSKDVSAIRNLSGSGNIVLAGDATFAGDLKVTGSSTLVGNVDIDGTLTCDDSLTIDSITITDTELGYLDGLTLGTVAASKVVTVDSNKDVSSFRNVTATGLLTIASITASAAIMPDDDNTQDLGSSAMRWRNIYTGDLHLANDRGNWTVIEETNFLSLRNNKTGQRFKLEMTLLDPGDGEYGPGNDGKL